MTSSEGSVQPDGPLCINEETEIRKQPRRNNSNAAALAFTSPESNVGLTPLPPCPWWKNGVGDTLPPKAEGGTLRRDEGTATDNKGTSGMDSCGGRPCKSGAASEAARDRDLRCCLLSPSAVLPDIFSDPCSVLPPCQESRGCLRKSETELILESFHGNN